MVDLSTNGLSKTTPERARKLCDDMTLALENVSISFGGIKALSDVSFRINEGQITGLIGPNGAGKTTLFNVITRYYKQDVGNVYFWGNSINHLETHQLGKIGLARTFQNLQLFKSLSVYENMLVCIPVSETKQHILDFLGLRKQNQILQDKISEILNFLVISDYKNVKAGSLPIGMQKLIELGRALMLNPKLLLLDEPAAGLNSQETDVLAKKIIEINRKHKTTILVVEHDMSLVMNICDRIIVLDFGKKIAEGVPMEIASNELVIGAYLGSDDNA